MGFFELFELGVNQIERLKNFWETIEFLINIWAKGFGILALLAFVFNLGFFAPLEFVINRIERLKQLWEKIEPLINIWKLFNIAEKVEILKQKMDTLRCLEEDVNTQLVSEEFQPGIKRKSEVDTWLKNVQRKKHDILCIESQIGERKRYLKPWLGSDIDKNIKQVEELYEQGKFPEGLFLDACQTSGEPLLTTPLEGQNSNENITKIWECLENNVVLRIGVHGVKGVGKTAIVTHIYNKLLQSTSLCDNVYWVTASEPLDIHKLQKDIAKQVGLNLLEEEDTRKRAARLFNALTKKKRSVLILDHICKHFQLEDVGIPNKVDGCKLVLTTRLSKVCRQMSCWEYVVQPLSYEEAKNLFIEKLGHSIPLTPKIEEIAKQIIEECGGLPHWIIDTANRMRGVDDISEWRNALAEVSDRRKGFYDY